MKLVEQDDPVGREGLSYILQRGITNYNKMKDDLFEVQEVIDRKIFSGKVLYKVKWAKYPIEEATWETIKVLSNVKDLIKEYKDRRRGKYKEQHGDQAEQEDLFNDEESDMEALQEENEKDKKYTKIIRLQKQEDKEKKIKDKIKIKEQKALKKQMKLNKKEQKRKQKEEQKRTQKQFRDNKRKGAQIRKLQNAEDGKLNKSNIKSGQNLQNNKESQALAHTNENEDQKHICQQQLTPALQKQFDEKIAQQSEKKCGKQQFHKSNANDRRSNQNLMSLLERKRKEGKNIEYIELESDQNGAEHEPNDMVRWSYSSNDDLQVPSFFGGGGKQFLEELEITTKALDYPKQIRDLEWDKEKIAGQRKEQKSGQNKERRTGQGKDSAIVEPVRAQRFKILSKLSSFTIGTRQPEQFRSKSMASGSAKIEKIYYLQQNEESEKVYLVEYGNGALVKMTTAVLLEEHPHHLIQFLESRVDSVI